LSDVKRKYKVFSEVVRKQKVFQMLQEDADSLSDGARKEWRISDGAREIADATKECRRELC
jgi:hypothetical protein